MLKQRVITGFILIILTVSAVFWLPTFGLAMLMLGIILLAGWEWSRLTGLHNTSSRIVFLLALMLCAWFAWWISAAGQVLLIMSVAGIWWALVLIILAVIQPSRAPSPHKRFGLGIAGLFTLVPAWVALVSLHESHPGLLLYLFFLIWIADSAAFFTGQRLGKSKLAPQLSPGKTREGLWGALLVTLVVGIVGALWLNMSVLQMIYFISLCLITTLISVAGDLFESLLKRQSGVKDSGTLFPGHGGVLDRIDSLTAAAPVFTLGLYWMSWPDIEIVLGL